MKKTLDAEANQFAALVDYLYDEWSVRAAVLIFVLYVAPLGDARAYAIVPLTVALVPVLLTELALFCHRSGILRYIYDTVYSFLSAAFIKVLFGLKQLQQSKIGQFILGLAGCNLALLAYFLYKNVHLMRLFSDFFTLIRTFIVSLGDPVAILLSFQDLLRTLAAYRTMEAVRTQYVDYIIRQIDAGSYTVIAEILFITAVLIMASILPYALKNARVLADKADEALGGEKKERKASSNAIGDLC